MSLERISAEEVLGKLADFSDVIDARSEGEYLEDHLPGAVNWPSLHDEERQLVGTQYKQISAFEAKKIGAALVAKNIALHIERDVLTKPREWQPLVYCWRGGKRSGSLALILDQIGFKVTLIEGGYKAFRAALVLDLPQLAASHNYRVICGTTGSGKTRLLQALAAHGAQVLDLEALANHRSSVLGVIPGSAQPSQKAYDRMIWGALKGFDTSRPVYIESESKKVGNVAIPEGLITAMRRAPCLLLELGCRNQHIEIEFPPDPTDSSARLKLRTGKSCKVHSINNERLVRLASSHGEDLVGLCYFGDQKSRDSVEAELSTQHAA